MLWGLCRFKWSSASRAGLGIPGRHNRISYSILGVFAAYRSNALAALLFLRCAMSLFAMILIALGSNQPATAPRAPDAQALRNWPYKS